MPPRLPIGSRRLAPLAVLALLGVAAYALWPGGRGPRLPDDPGRRTVVFLGDSITSGHGLPLEVAFPHRLGAALGVPVRNAGISGDRTEGGVARLQDDVLAHRPRLVVVELGVNDIFGRVPRERTVENLRTIARRVRTAGAGVLLVHVRLPGVLGDGYRQDLREIARSEGAWLLEDFLEDVVPGLTTDGLHPNAEGHARLATRLEPVLRDVLAR